jgi:predicted aspartyl protease
LGIATDVAARTLAAEVTTMGLTYVDGVVSGPSGEPRPVRCLVDSGAKYSLLPVDVWRAVGSTPKRRLAFVLADGTQIERDVSECHLTLPQGDSRRARR